MSIETDNLAAVEHIRRIERERAAQLTGGQADILRACRNGAHVRGGGHGVYTLVSEGRARIANSGDVDGLRALGLLMRSGDAWDITGEGLRLLGVVEEKS